MTVASLLYESPTFAFEHAMDHRWWIGTWGQDVRPYLTAIPYWVDPMTNSPMWRLDHQQAHWDAMNPPPPPTPMGPFGAPVTQILWQNDMSSADRKKWWMHMNRMEHVLCDSNIAQQQLPVWYPFW